MSSISDFISSFANVKEINRGWSVDRKYYLQDTHGKDLFLRTFDLSQYKRKKQEFEVMQALYTIDVPIAQPIKLGKCDDGGYVLTGWIEGKSLSKDIASFPEIVQHSLGMRSGEILRRMHSIIPTQLTDAQEQFRKFERKMDYVFNRYGKSDLSLPGVDKVFSYISENKYLVENRPQTFMHMDFGAGNIMLENGKLKIVDFETFDFGDPWQDLRKINANTFNPNFATGIIRGYFNGEPPAEFWSLLALYTLLEAVNIACWASTKSPKNLENAKKYYDRIFKGFNFHEVQIDVPAWYLA